MHLCTHQYTLSVIIYWRESIGSGSAKHCCDPWPSGDQSDSHVQRHSAFVAVFAMTFATIYGIRTPRNFLTPLPEHAFNVPPATRAPVASMHSMKNLKSLHYSNITTLRA